MKDGKTMFEVHTHGGRRPTGLEAVEWAQAVVRLGAGEIVLTSMDADGTQDGYDLEMTEAVAAAIQEHRPACVIHEGNGTRWGVVPARGEFLQGLRQLTTDNDTLLILDEVITGFRVHPGGFQAYCDIVPDMTTMAKVLAGGLPGGCLAGRTDLLDVLAFDNPLGKKMKHPGTFNANPLSAAAGRAALDVVASGEPSRVATERAAALRRGLNEAFAARGVGWVAYGDFSAIKIIPGRGRPAMVTTGFPTTVTTGGWT